MAPTFSHPFALCEIQIAPSSGLLHARARRVCSGPAHLFPSHLSLILAVTPAMPAPSQGCLCSAFSPHAPPLQGPCPLPGLPRHSTAWGGGSAEPLPGGGTPSRSSVPWAAGCAEAPTPGGQLRAWHGHRHQLGWILSSLSRKRVLRGTNQLPLAAGCLSFHAGVSLQPEGAGAHAAPPPGTQGLCEREAGLSTP